MDKNLNTPIWQLTAGELIEFFIAYLQPKQEETPAKCDENLVYGIAEVKNSITNIRIWKQ